MSAQLRAITFLVFAWVLWNETTFPNGPPLWSIKEAFELKKECNNHRLKEIAWKLQDPRTKKRGGVIFTVYKMKKGSKIAVDRYICLPGTIDPRPKK